ncbi:MAG: hypothetical protein CMO55_20175 [Verrucomicrobiales bacterium]|nr:hypothetical protein [Verrucomicrobiales bacterium]
MTNRDEEASAGPVSTILEEWEQNPYSFPNGNEPTWRFCVGKREALASELCAVFVSAEGDRFPRGYQQSLEQRFQLLQKVVPLSEREAYSFEARSGGALELWCPYFEGEPVVPYLRNRGAVSADLSFELLGDIVDGLIGLVKTPRLLSGLTLGDFYVCARDGIKLEAKVFAPPSLLRTEVPLSDYQIAKRWIEMIAQVFLGVKAGWKGELSSHDPHGARPFRKLLKELSLGKERSLIDRMVDLRRVVYSCVSGSVRGERMERVALGRFPRGVLSEHFISGLAEEEGGVSSALNSHSGGKSGFSNFVFEVGSGPEERRVCYLVPPDDWVGVPMVDVVNRKLSHAFLHVHHNGVRARSVLCQGDCTALLADPSVGMPLPALLRFRGGVKHEEFMFLFQKIHRALGAFESTEFPLRIVSPWQLQIHLEELQEPPDWRVLLCSDIREWPSWDVRIRVELPMEFLLRSQNSPSWGYVFDDIGRKFFPALVAWVLDWERFELAYETGTLFSEPLNRDERFDALFQAARKFLEATDYDQRENFLRMVDEGVRGMLEERSL